MRVECPFYHQVPKTLRENLLYRKRIHERVIEDPSFAKVMYRACAEDPLFYLNAFCWTFDPRVLSSPKIPFISYPFQDTAIVEIIRAIGEHDLLIEKSRDMGASWINLFAIEWCWHFLERCSFMLVSRKKEMVDQTDNSDTLYWKIDFIHQNQPVWLMPPGFNRDKHRTLMRLYNPHGKSVINGESTNGDLGRGGRRTAILLDEFAAVECDEEALSATRDNTNCRLINSTPKGTNNAYYRQRQNPAMKRLTLHWSEHPVKARGLYTTYENGLLKVIDPINYPKDYAPIIDGKLRSPWYDNQCARASSKREIAQELDIDYLGSGGQFFDGDALAKVKAIHAMPPYQEGELEYTEDGLLVTDREPFHEHSNGRLKLWLLLNNKGRPPEAEQYSIGVDVSAGAGSSNSAASVWNIKTNEKVASYTNPYIRPEDFAVSIVALAHFFNDAMIIAEAQGPGVQFHGKLIDLNYFRFYCKTQETSIAKRETDTPGWGSTRDTKLLLVGNYRSALQSGLAINHDMDAVDECHEYIYDSAQGVRHSKSKKKDDPSGAEKNHGDRVMADALGWKLVLEQHRIPQQEEPEAAYGSLAWRMKMKEEEDRSKRFCELSIGWGN